MTMKYLIDHTSRFVDIARAFLRVIMLLTTDQLHGAAGAEKRCMFWAQGGDKLIPRLSTADECYLKTLRRFV